MRSNEPRKPKPDRLGRWIGVALFWLLAIGFVTVSTRSVMLQVFGTEASTAAHRTTECARSLRAASRRLHQPDSAHEDAEAWRTWLRAATAACGKGDPTIQQLTAVIIKMGKRVHRNALAVKNEHARLRQALPPMSDSVPLDKE